MQTRLSRVVAAGWLQDKALSHFTHSSFIQTLTVIKHLLCVGHERVAGGTKANKTPLFWQSEPWPGRGALQTTQVPQDELSAVRRDGVQTGLVGGRGGHLWGTWSPNSAALSNGGAPEPECVLCPEGGKTNCSKKWLLCDPLHTGGSAGRPGPGCQPPRRNPGNLQLLLGCSSLPCSGNPSVLLRHSPLLPSLDTHGPSRVALGRDWMGWLRNRRADGADRADHAP